MTAFLFASLQYELLSPLSSDHMLQFELSESDEHMNWWL